MAFFGNSEFSSLVLEKMKALGILPNIIITTPDKPKGRKMELAKTPTKIWAEDNSIEYLEAENLKDEGFLEKASLYDIYIVASYGKIIPKNLLDMPKYGVLNVHPSLLPKYRGPSPLQEQILNNEKDVGVSVMLVDERVDHGPVLTQKKVEMENWPVGFNKLSKILAEEGAEILSEILPDWIKGKIKAKEQNHNQATFTKKVEKNDGLTDLSANPFKNYLKYLAYEEWPKTFFEITKNNQKKRVLIKKAEWKNGELKILRVIPEGKKEMSYDDFQRGL